MREIDSEQGASRRERVIAFTRQVYATPRSEVEAQLNREPSPPETVMEEANPISKKIPDAGPTINVTTDQVVPVHNRQIAPVTPSPIPRKPQAPVIAPLGKGGQQHKYLQQLLTQWAQGLGYHAVIEMPAPDGAGSVDVVLEKGSRKVACEISVTSTVEQELGNLRKCLAGGFTDVFMICSEARTLKGLQKASHDTFGSDRLRAVHFVSVDEMFTAQKLMDTADAPKEQTVRGYKVKVNLRTVNDHQASERRRMVSEVLMRSMRKHD